MNPNQSASSCKNPIILNCIFTMFVMVFTSLQVGALPIEVATLADLQNIGSGGQFPLDSDYILTADIDAAATSGWNAGAGFAPIGSLATPFTGSFDGQGHSITGLVINRPAAETVGLFGYCGTNSLLKDVALIDANVTGGTYGVGILAGWVRGGVVDGCFASGIVTCNTHDTRVGGLLGWLDESDCIASWFSGTVTGSGAAIWVGGLTGDNSSGLISRCYASGAVTSNGASSQAGGLSAHQSNRYGSARTSQIEKSFSTATVQALGASWGGGLVAVVGGQSSIEQCWASGAVTAENLAGGLAAQTQIKFVDCYARGPVTGAALASGVGGFAAQFQQYIGGADRCYATGLVTPVGVSTWKGGFGAFPATDGLVEHSFWDTESTGQPTSALNTGTGQTTAQMKSLATFQGAGWSIADGAMEGFVWAILPGDYPYLPAAQPIGLSGNFTLISGGGNVVGSLEGLGPARGDWIFDLIPGAGDTNNDLFEISGQTLQALDASSMAAGDYSIRVGGNPPATMGAASAITAANDETTSAIFTFESPFTISVLPPGMSDGWVSY